MINTDFLKQLVVLYVEDDPTINEKMTHVLNTLFKEAISCVNGVEGLKCFRDSMRTGQKVDVIISDINMPEMDGIEMLKEIRELDKDIPFMFTTAYSDVKYTMTAIKYGVSHYAVKPINTKELLLHIQDICEVKYQQRLVEKARIELERYVDVVNQVAIISKTDPKGIITFVNDIFCEISKYSREELLGQNQNIVRHQDMPSQAFKGMWSDIKKGLSWKGKVKNKAKDGEPYFVNATIFPVYDSYNEHIIEYVGIRFLTTEEENEKREFKKKVMQLYQESQRKDFTSRAKIDELEAQIQKYKQYDMLAINLEQEKEKNDTLKNQVTHYENMMKEQKESHETLMTKIQKRLQESFNQKEKTEVENRRLADKYQKTLEQLEENQETLERVNQREQEQAKTIRDLRDVIEYYEDQLNK